MKKKHVALLLACVMMLGVAVGGTLAWLTATAPQVENTFTPSTIKIELKETGMDANGEQSFKMIPGDVLVKDPKVTVLSGSEACWLFVAVTESENLDTYIDYSVRTGSGEWTKLDGYKNIYYRTVDENQIGTDFYILTNNAVSVKTSVDKDAMDAILTSGQPTLTFNACAVQRAHIDTVADAWVQAAEGFKNLAAAN